MAIVPHDAVPFPGLVTKLGPNAADYWIDPLGRVYRTGGKLMRLYYHNGVSKTSPSVRLAGGSGSKSVALAMIHVWGTPKDVHPVTGLGCTWTAFFLHARDRPLDEATGEPSTAWEYLRYAPSDEFRRWAAGKRRAGVWEILRYDNELFPPHAE